MKLLLDTHALLWLLLDDRRLSPKANEAIDDPASELLISPVSAYEITLKHNLGKLAGATAIAGDFGATVMALRCSDLPVSIAHAQHAGGLDLIHRDPFDRLLAAQAIVENVPIVSADSAFDRLGARRIW